MGIRFTALPQGVTVAAIPSLLDCHSLTRLGGDLCTKLVMHQTNSLHIRMHEIDLHRLDLNLLVAFDVLMTERNVTRAAARLARTQSAVSHSLARLREQVGDPLMIRVGGRMVATPFAERLIEDVRPILPSIKRALASPKTFDPTASTQTFRLAIPDFAPSLLPRVMERVRREAPGVALDWSGEESHTPMAVAEGQIDVALIASAVSLPGGLQWQEAEALKWATLDRKSTRLNSSHEIPSRMPSSA